MAKKRSKRANGEGSIYPLPGGKWRAVLTVGWTAEGKRMRRSKTAKSYADASAFLLEIRGQSTSAIHGHNQTLGEFLEGWLAHVRESQSENTEINYRLTVENHILPWIGRKKLGDIRPQTIRSLVSELAHKGTGTRTVENAYVILKNALSVAVKEELIQTNPCNAVSRPKHESKDIFPFTHEEAKMVLAATEIDRQSALFALAFSTGLRTAELFGLEWADIDFEKGMLRIERQATSISGRVVVKPPKTAAGKRQIELTPKTVQALEDRRRVALAEGHAATPLVFPGRRGAYQRRGTFRTRVWQPLLKKIALEHRGFHHVRHTYATLALLNGVPLPTVSQILGHAKPSTTLDIYCHVLPTHQTAAVQSMTRLFG